jgi:glutamyl-Q tRNA(Asp) synthetase
MSAYRGRFAPSPTGPLHFGSLFAALVSYLEAKNHQGKWLVRIEDIDPLREMSGASELIISTLDAHQLYWDEEISYQSNNASQYEALLERLQQEGAVFRCPCSRKQLAENGGQHSQACRDQAANLENYALKFRKTNYLYEWLDGFQGAQYFRLNDDFVLKRKEGFYAYQLAVVNDDYQQGITHVVRGHDLLDSTPMQLALYKALNIEAPVFSHFPVLCLKGQKLSKQNYAKAVDDAQAVNNLRSALRLLKLEKAAKETSIAHMLKTAIELWDPKTLHGATQFVSPL